MICGMLIFDAVIILNNESLDIVFCVREMIQCFAILTGKRRCQAMKYGYAECKTTEVQRDRERERFLEGH